MESQSHGRPASELRTRSTRRRGKDSEFKIVGRSPGLLAALDTARRVANTQLPVLVVGETGTGKELIARFVHRESERRGEFVDVDCGALPSELIEALLFGHKRGAFTGAIEHSQGMIARAEGGTLLLDELGSLPPQGQAKLLRVLETGEVRRVGSTRTRRVDFRLVATAQEDVRNLVADRRFRLDLLQRIAGIVIRLPSLAERPSDIVALARHFAGLRGMRTGKEAELLLRAQNWPGNIRQLRWTIERAAVFSPTGVIDAACVREALETGPGMLFEKRTSTPVTQLKALCRAHDGDPGRIADALNVGRSTLYRRLKDAGIDLQSYRQAAG